MRPAPRARAVAVVAAVCAGVAGLCGDPRVEAQRRSRPAARSAPSPFRGLRHLTINALVASDGRTGDVVPWVALPCAAPPGATSHPVPVGGSDCGCEAFSNRFTAASWRALQCPAPPPVTPLEAALLHELVGAVDGDAAAAVDAAVNADAAESFDAAGAADAAADVAELACAVESYQAGVWVPVARIQNGAAVLASLNAASESVVPSCGREYCERVVRVDARGVTGGVATHPSSRTRRIARMPEGAPLLLTEEVSSALAFIAPSTPETMSRPPNACTASWARELLLRCETTARGALLVPARCEAVAASDGRSGWMPATCAVSRTARCPALLEATTVAHNQASYFVREARDLQLDALTAGVTRRLLAFGRGFTVERHEDMIYLQSPQSGERSVVITSLRDRWQGTIHAVRAGDAIRIILTVSGVQSRRNTEDEEDWRALLEATRAQPYFDFMMRAVNAEAAALCRAVAVDSTTVRCTSP